MADRHLAPDTPEPRVRDSRLRIFGIAAAAFVVAFLTGSLVSYLIEGVPYYRESAITGLIVGGLMAWQLHQYSKNEDNG